MQQNKLMNIALLYPSNPLAHHQVDEQYQEEYAYAKQAGLLVHCFDIDQIGQSKIFPALTDNHIILYRGYMLTQIAYEQLEQRFGSRLLTNKSSYFNAHYLPNWYESIKELTIPSLITTEEKAKEDFKKYGNQVFIKDYVKSLKTGKGSIVDNQEDLDRAITDMKHYRGIIEGGIVLRQVIDLQEHTEKRFFVIRNNIFTPHDNIDQTCLALVTRAVSLLQDKGLVFYSIDTAVTREGKNVIIEIGDGQVSDYVGWHVERFVQVLSAACSAVLNKSHIKKDKFFV